MAHLFEKGIIVIFYVKIIKSGNQQFLGHLLLFLFLVILCFGGEVYYPDIIFHDISEEFRGTYILLRNDTSAKNSSTKFQDLI